MMRPFSIKSIFKKSDCAKPWRVIKGGFRGVRRVLERPSDFASYFLAIDSLFCSVLFIFTHAIYYLLHRALWFIVHAIRKGEYDLDDEREGTIRQIGIG